MPYCAAMTRAPMTSTRLEQVFVSGAAGKVGRAVRDALSPGFSLLLSDLRDPGPLAEGESFRPADLTDFAAVKAAMQGADSVVHLGAIPDEDSYERVRAVNMDGTQNVLEAARGLGVRRVVFASSIHAVGFAPRSEMVGPAAPVRPDSFYGVSKVFGEALGRMYHDRYGLEFVAVRICSFQPRPRDARQLSTWLSPRDAGQLFLRALLAEEVGFLTVAGISANTRRWMTPEGWDRLGYSPQDDAEAYAHEVEHLRGEPGSRQERYQGGVFSEPDYLGLAAGHPSG